MEKRVYQRLPVQMAASYGMPEAKELIQKATVVNISGGGFCFISAQALEPGTQIRLRVEVRRHERVTIDVETVWSKKDQALGKYQVGVKIVSNEGEDFEKFLSFYCEQVKQTQKAL